MRCSWGDGSCMACDDTGGVPDDYEPIRDSLARMAHRMRVDAPAPFESICGVLVYNPENPRTMHGYVSYDPPIPFGLTQKGQEAKAK